MNTNQYEQLKLDLSQHATEPKSHQHDKTVTASIISIQDHNSRKQDEYEKHLNSRILSRSVHIL